MKGLDKVEAARRQLGTATWLFLRDQDPVSVYCLAAGAANVLAPLVQTAGVHDPFHSFALESFPGMSAKDLIKVRNGFWNAFKHLDDGRGGLRDDSELFDEFDDEANDGVLFAAWFDYAQLTHAMPIEAQVLTAWVIARATPDDYNFAAVRLAGLPAMNRRRQKEQLRRAIVWARKAAKYRSDPRNELRALESRVEYEGLLCG